MQPLAHIQRFVRVVAHLPPWAYLATYASAIVLFGALYSANSAAFLHPYAKLEPTATEGAATVRDVLSAGFRGAIHSTTQAAESRGVRVETSGVSRIQPEEGRLRLALPLTVSTNVGPRAELHTVASFVLNPQNRLVTVQPIGQVRVTLFPDVSQEAPNPFPRLSEPELGLSHIRDEVVAATTRITLDRAGYEDVTRFVQTAADPEGIRGVFGRMLYLSAITIATVGYGDIVPLTPLTRSLTAIEAVIGIVLLGLFVNSLQRR